MMIKSNSKIELYIYGRKTINYNLYEFQICQNISQGLIFIIATNSCAKNNLNDVIGIALLCKQTKTMQHTEKKI